MKVLLVRSGQELEVAKALLKEAGRSSLVSAQKASVDAELIRATMNGESAIFQRRINRMRSNHRNRVASINARAERFDSRAAYLTAQAESIREVLELL